MHEIMKIKYLLVYGAFISLFSTSTSALPDYQSRIPNGDNVPHPCFGNDIWSGVGHQSHAGGGLLNPFGEDFKTYGYKWDRCLCMIDSDGDGKSNGEELGDPDCEFAEGDIPVITEGISHPGICEPVDDSDCMQRNGWEVCEPVDFKCDEIHDEGVEVYHLLFPETVIPDEETVYYCMAVQFNDTYDVHAFAMEPVLDNRELVHHIDMMECTSNAEDILRDYAVPGPCSDMPSCNGKQLAAWSLGQSGICLPPSTGITLGTTGAKVASLRIHYHNPMHRINETDSSGLYIYATPQMRPNEASVLNIQQMYLEIPPGQAEHSESALLTELCTHTFQEDIYLIMGFFHMHYLGKAAYAELWRDGHMIQEIYRDDHYRFDAPVFKQFEEAIVVKPNDTIRSVCIFQSLERTNITWRGQASTDEMCGHNFVYYPQQNFLMAKNNGALLQCQYLYGGTVSFWDELCDYNEFTDIYNRYMRQYLESVCDTTGKQCLTGCKDMLEWAFNNHSCLAENARTAIFKKHGEFNMMQSSCKDYPPVMTIPDPTTNGPDGDPEACAEAFTEAPDNGGMFAAGTPSIFTLLVFVMATKQYD